MRPARWLRVALGTVAAAAVGGCFATSEPGLRSPDPSVRLSAIVDAGRESDQDAVPALVERLDSDDPAERLLAIQALERITGETLGYDHAAPRAKRDEAVERWTARVRAQPPHGARNGRTAPR